MAALNTGVHPIWPLSVVQYHAMIDKGILSPDDPVELLEGIIVQKMSKNPPQRIATRAVRQTLEHVVPAGWYVDEQEPITLSSSEPEPDVAVIRGDSRDYTDRHPAAPDVALIVEVSDATLDRDRILKKRIYATAGIPTYWVLDLGNRRLEAYSQPRSGDYQQCTVYRQEDRAPVVLAGFEGSVLVADLLP
jgi:Uma2 family endonuclease